jgi:RNA polymerase sigma-70 factor (ECF subfamily)
MSAGVPARRRPGADVDLPLLRAAQADPAAFEALYRMHVDGVYSYAFYQLGDHHDAEDVTERTFLAALAALPGFEERGATVRSWLYRIAHNAIANQHRTRARRRTEPLDAVAERRAPDDVGGAVERRDELRRVRAALRQISDERRRVIILRFVDELSCREIGEVVGRSEGAVRVLLHRALRELHARLEGQSRP